MSVMLAGGGTEGFSISQARPGAPVGANIQRWSAPLEQALNEFRPSRIIIGSGFDGDPASLRGLARVGERVEELHVPGTPKLDLEFISELTGLRKLSSDQMADGPSFKKLVHLEKCYLHKPIKTLGRLWEAPALAELHLWSVPLRTMEMLAPFAALRRLTLRQVDSLTSLDGVHALQLELLDLIYCRRLTSVAALHGMSSLEILRLTGSSSIGDLASAGAWPNLRSFAISSGPPVVDFALLEGSPRLEGFSINSTDMVGTPCSIVPLTRMPGLKHFGLRAGPKKGFKCLRDVERLAELPSLEYLMLDRGPDLPNVQFLRALTNLTTLRLTRTNILDGDLSPVLELPHLAKLQLDPHRKHYSHAFPELITAWNAIHRPTAELRLKRTGPGAERAMEEAGDAKRK
jgi:hypothetical protein